MTPCSGAARIAFVLASLAPLAMPPPALAQTAPAQAGPQPGTASAVACLVSLEPWGCQTAFAPAWQNAARRSTTFCTVEYTHRWLDNCYAGPLESIQYLGIDPEHADVYAVNYLSAHMTYVVFPKRDDGRIPGFTIFNSAPAAVRGPWGMIAMAAASSPPLYIRPAQDD